MKNKKLLLFTDWYYPGYKAGGPIQSCKNLVQLLKDHFEIYVITSDRDLHETAPYDSIIADQWTIPEPSVNIYYSSPGKMTAGFITQELNAINPDFVYLNSMFSYQYAILPVRVVNKLRHPAKVILAPRGMLHEGALKFKRTKKLFFLNLFRWLGWAKKIHFHATDEQELKDVMKYFPGSHVSVIQNIPNLSKEAPEAVPKVQGELRMVFLSRISPKKNIYSLIKWLTETTLPYKWSLDIYGSAEDQSYFEKCKSKSEHAPVKFMGSINNNQVQKMFTNYHCFVLPTLGENFGHAIYESLSVGLPVVISKNTPWTDLEEKKAGFDVDIQTGTPFLNALTQLAEMGEAEYSSWSNGALDLARDYYENADFLNKYLILFS